MKYESPKSAGQGWYIRKPQSSWSCFWGPSPAENQVQRTYQRSRASSPSNKASLRPVSSHRRRAKLASST